MICRNAGNDSGAGSISWARCATALLHRWPFLLKCAWSAVRSPWSGPG